MKVAEMMQSNGSVFLRSEWEPISDAWPAVSFGNRRFDKELKEKFKPGRDILIFVGVDDSDKTKDFDHRHSLMSALVPDPSRVHDTKNIIPSESLARAKKENGKYWPYSLIVLRAANFVGPPYPDAREFVRTTYSSIGVPGNNSHFVKVREVEREAVMALEVLPVTLKRSPDVAAYLEMQELVKEPKWLNEEATRMADLITNRVEKGGTS